MTRRKAASCSSLLKAEQPTTKRLSGVATYRTYIRIDKYSRAFFPICRNCAFG